MLSRSARLTSRFVVAGAARATAASTPAFRAMSANASAGASSRAAFRGVGLAAAGLGGLAFASLASMDESVDYDAVRQRIVELFDEDESRGPLFVRLAWHASGTWCKHSKTGGSDGATMRYSPESGHGANAGLGLARSLLEPIKQDFPGLSYADLWVLASYVVIAEMGGPSMKFKPGRTDATSPAACPPDGRLPDAAQGAAHIRDIFYRMGFSDEEIVALNGAHALGECHADRSGFVGPWTNAPTTFGNHFFTQLLNSTWKVKNWEGPKQYEDETGQLMMLPTDMSLLDDESFSKYVHKFAEDESAFFEAFAAAYKRLTEFGVNFPEPTGRRRYFFFGPRE